MDFESVVSPVKDSATSIHSTPRAEPLVFDPNPAEAMKIFTRGIVALPNDVLRSIVLDKYAATERKRHQLLVATWDLEATKRKVRTLEEIQSHIECLHADSESEFKFWRGMYTDRGLPDLSDDELFFGDRISSVAREADQEDTELSVMVEHAKACSLEIGRDV